MKDQSKTKQVLIRELTSLRQRIAELEQFESGRQRAEESRRESEEKLLMALYGAEMGMWDIDITTASGTIDERAAQILGYHKDEIPSQIHAWDEMTHPDDVPLIKESIKAHLEGRIPVFQTDHRMRMATGEWKWVHGRGKITKRHKDGSPICISGTIHDIAKSKQAEEVSKLSQIRLSTIMDNMGDIVAVFDFNGIVTFITDSYQRILGYGRDELIGQNAFEYIHPDDLEQVMRSFAATIESSSETEIFRFCHRDGQYIWFEGVSRIMRNEEGSVEGVVVGCRDITECKQVEEALAQAAREWQSTFDATNDAIWTLDQDQRVLQSNKTAERLFHRPLGELIGKHCFEIVHGTEQPIPECPFLLMRKSLHRETMELQVGEDWYAVTVDPILDAAGQYSGAVHIVGNITERKRAEDALRESEEKFRVAQEFSPDGFTILRPIRDAEGRVVDFTWVYENATIARLNGTEPNAVVGRRLLELFPGHRDSQFLRAYQQVAEKGEICTFEESYCGETISERTWFRIAVVPAGGDIAILAQDITARKRDEERLKSLLLEKETILKEIHHRVKNNLQVISSLLGLQSSYLQDEKARELFQESQDRVKIMANIHTMLYQSDDLSRVDYGGFIRDLTGRLQQSYGSAGFPIEVHADIADVSLDIETSIPCGLILNELVSNALKHAFPGGREGGINITMRQKDQMMTLTVQDNGIGFPGSLDFQNTKSLGLELVNLLVGQINGKITLQVEGGTTFTITFPAVSEGG